MRILLTGGGTGGHIYPALAVAEALKADHDLLYVGHPDKLESRIVPQAGLAFSAIRFSGMPRQAGLPWARWVCDLVVAVFQAMRLVYSFRPQVVIGTGGYVSAPVLMAAKLAGVPYLLHEPDAHPGLVNKLMSRGAEVATVAFAAGVPQLKAKRVEVTGNPIRQSVLEVSGQQVNREAAFQQLALPWNPAKPVLLVTGGSQGARSINTAIAKALPTLLDEFGLQIIHQTGEKLYEETRALVSETYQHHPAYCCRPYYPDMGPVLAMADFAVCRAGSLSLSEMYLAGLPTILVPYPFAAADHQRKNAQASVDAGASLMLDDAGCSPQALSELIRVLVEDKCRRQSMAEASRGLGRPDATQAIVRLLLGITRD